MTNVGSNTLIIIATLVAFVGLDAPWLILVGGPMFQSQVGPILLQEPKLGAAAVFYAIYTFGIFFLAIRPALADRSLARAALNGAVLGLTAYATFDLTNLAIIRGWTVGLAAVDIAWGTVATAIASIAGYLMGIAAGRRA